MAVKAVKTTNEMGPRASAGVGFATAPSTSRRIAPREEESKVHPEAVAFPLLIGERNPQAVENHTPRLLTAEITNGAGNALVGKVCGQLGGSCTQQASTRPSKSERSKEISKLRTLPAEHYSLPSVSMPLHLDAITVSES